MDWSSLADSTLPTLHDEEDKSSGMLQALNLNVATTAVQQQQPKDSLSLGLPAPRRSTTAPNHFPQHRPERFETLEQGIQRYETDLLNAAFEKGMQANFKATDRALEDQIQAAWEADRDAWMQKLWGYQPKQSQSNALSLNSSAASGVRLLPRQQQPRGLGAVPQQSQQPLDHKMVDTHWKIVQQMKNQAARMLIPQLSSGIASPRPSSALLGYLSALDFCRNHQGTAGTSAMDQAKATLSHFCKQYQEIVLNRVRHHAASGSNSESNYEAYAQLTTMDSTTGVWPALYFALRCGDAAAALAVLQKQQERVDPSVQHLVYSMAQAQSSLPCLWDAPATQTYDRSAQDQVTTLLESAKHTDRPNVYQLGVYSLLSGGAPVTSEKYEGFKQIEDFLTGSLWKAVMSGGDSDIHALAEQVLKLGPSHFEDSAASGGWSYALPLLACQQYQRALIWLTEVGGSHGLLQAAHIGLFLSKAGIHVENLGDKTSNEPSDDFVASMLSQYANLVVSNGGSPVAALDYLVCIPQAARGRKEVAKLIAATTTAGVELVGVEDAQGQRQGGALSNFYSVEDIAYILRDAAKTLSNERNNLDKTRSALSCFMLAESYQDYLSLLNELLSPPEKQDGNRRVWIEVAQQFLSNYIDKQTHVLTKLQQENKASLIDTCRTLKDLNEFYESHRLGRRSSNEGIVEQLLPRANDSMQSKFMLYNGMDPLVKQSYPSLLLVSMEHVYKEYIRRKQEQGSSTGRQRMTELAALARLYTSFATQLATLSSDELGRLTQYESQMI